MTGLGRAYNIPTKEIIKRGFIAVSLIVRKVQWLIFNYTVSKTPSLPLASIIVFSLSN